MKHQRSFTWWLRPPQWQDMVLPGSQPDKGELGPRLCCPVPVTMAVFVQSWAPTGAALGPWRGPQPSPLLLASRSEMVWEPGCLRKGSHGPHRPLPPSPGPHSCCPKACPDPTLHGTVRSEFRQKDGPVFCLTELFICKKFTLGTSLVVQWLGICLPMQGTRVQSLAGEDPMCCGATKPVLHSY